MYYFDGVRLNCKHLNWNFFHISLFFWKMKYGLELQVNALLWERQRQRGFERGKKWRLHESMRWLPNLLPLCTRLLHVPSLLVFLALPYHHHLPGPSHHHHPRDLSFSWSLTLLRKVPCQNLYQQLQKTQLESSLKTENLLPHLCPQHRAYHQAHSSCLMNICSMNKWKVMLNVFI